MNVGDAKDVFVDYLRARGAAVPTTPRAAVNDMLAFYRDVRANDCTLADDNDMLLVQWGMLKYRPYGPMVHFSFNITRQLIAGPGGDGNIYQLYLTFAFPPEPDLVAFGKMRAEKKAKRWCRHPNDLGSYEAFIVGEQEYAAVADRSTEERDFGYTCV